MPTCIITDLEKWRKQEEAKNNIKTTIIKTILNTHSAFTCTFYFEFQDLYVHSFMYCKLVKYYNQQSHSQMQKFWRCTKMLFSNFDFVITILHVILPLTIIYFCHPYTVLGIENG
jgi:hypothetical protein